MSFVFENPNPECKAVGDCVVRALSIALGEEWAKIYIDLTLYGLIYCDMPSSNAVWGEYLKSKGFTRQLVPNGYNTREFCKEFKEGRYILATGTHVIAIIDGNYYDAWDSGNEMPVYYWKRDDEK